MQVNEQYLPPYKEQYQVKFAYEDNLKFPWLAKEKSDNHPESAYCTTTNFGSVLDILFMQYK